MIQRRLYSMWVIFSIALFFMVFIIPQMLCAPFRFLHPLALKINYWWAWGFFRLSFLPVREHWQFKLKKGQQYILCANHFSYLDIPAMGLVPLNFKFVGKSQIGKIPLFGFMYNRIHITVNRSSYRSRANSLLKARNELKLGYSMGFFPEGGIRSKEFPKMIDFKDGAFRLAAENNVPIIPITYASNYNILPDDQFMSIRRMPCHIIYHAPIYPGGTSEEHIKQLRDEVFRVIQTELDQHS